MAVWSAARHVDAAHLTLRGTLPPTLFRPLGLFGRRYRGRREKCGRPRRPGTQFMWPERGEPRGIRHRASASLGCLCGLLSSVVKFGPVHWSRQCLCRLPQLGRVQSGDGYQASFNKAWDNST